MSGGAPGPSSAGAQDLVAVLRSYVDRMLREVPGMKVLLLDSETTRVVSTVFSQSEILEQEVYLVERLDGESGEQLFHLKAVCFLRPTRENIARIRRELRQPRFGEYHLFFTNRVEDMRLQDLAEMDVKEMVQQVQEYFGDFMALEGHHFQVPLSRPHLAMQPFSWDFGNSSDAISRMTEGVASLMLSLRRRFHIRYQRGSEICERFAQALHHLTAIEEQELFDFGSRGEAPPVLLVLDRRDDPVTPLLSQWTYQAMVHEVVGIAANRVDLRHVPGIKPEFAEAVLSAQQDPFFRTNMYSNFGDLGMAVKGLVDAASTEHNKAREFQTIDQMASFIENLPDYNHQQGVTYKHVTLMSELSHAVERRGLMAVSGVEQDVACQAPSLAAHYEAVSELVGNLAIEERDRMRLVLLFALRYERDGQAQLASLLRTLQDQGAYPQRLQLLRFVLQQCSADKRVADIFQDRSMSSRFANLAKQHLKGVENVYTQHTPPLVSLLEKAARGKLPEQDYPRVDKGGMDGLSGQQAPRPPRMVVVFVIGGTTYEEAKAVAELNAAGERGEGWSSGLRLLLGGTSVQSSTSFLQDLQDVMTNERYAR
ncbi:vacuolar sorting-associated 45-like protein [Micractinium conductrix]|uniref:Vacuolar sorting-associated 45-like protein n=1 Tax=Micractinium conductrix TaxID=554055 RepID=A0A2P6V5W7_9CHLO|nr:vacuolar sorting-associated 45-like protein [Micractinium conductrix]|eukprot:PSC69479.1 vacuolar sorting-associated 45-like protein [Micractinium conductrix]